VEAVIAAPQDPLVSVVIPTYNRSHVLRCALRSALWQTLGEFEVLVIGDGCTDDSGDVVASFGDRRLRWHNLSANSGCQGVPNQRGLELARGRYVAYLLHDDVWHPRHLEFLVRCLARKDADLGHTIVSYIGPPGSGLHELQGVRSLARADRCLLPTSLMHTRELGLRAGGWRHRRDSGLLPDIDFTARVRTAARQIVAVRRLTAFAFPAWCRDDSYTSDPCHEQEACLSRIEQDPRFVLSEFAATVPAQVSRGVARRLFPRRARAGSGQTPAFTAARARTRRDPVRRPGR
jgi:glycosyltransferase involved in cell wall biosynthesis